MPKNKCIFQAKWLDDPLYNQWLKKKSNEVALCSYCKKEINIGNMGETALTALERKETPRNFQIFLYQPYYKLLEKTK